MHYRFGDFILDVEHRNLSCRGNAIACDDRMITLLDMLIQAYPAHCEQQILLQKIWPNTVVSNWSIARLISDTRKLFKANGLNTQLIQTLHGRGYRLSHDIANQLQRLNAHSESQTAPAVYPHANKAIENSTLVKANSRLATRILILAAMGLVLLLGVLFLWPQGHDELKISEAPGVKGRILWVDDHPQNNEAERQYLQQHNLAVYLTSTTEEALMLTSMYQYDVIITDMGRQQDPLAGLKLTKTLRQTGNNTPIYIYTIMPSEAQQQLVFQFGAQGIAVDDKSLYQLLAPLLLTPDGES